jgi:hypothetical protein
MACRGDAFFAQQRASSLCADGGQDLSLSARLAMIFSLTGAVLAFAVLTPAIITKYY